MLTEPAIITVDGHELRLASDKGMSNVPTEWNFAIAWAKFGKLEDAA